MSANQAAEKVTTVLNGIPLCTKDDCPQYDGKRCRLSGSRPGHVCEPAVGEMAAELARLTSLLEEARDGGYLGHRDSCPRWHSLAADVPCSCKYSDLVRRLYRGILTERA